MAESQYGFPTEVLSLPSKGLLYPEDSPLRSGTIDVKYMTAKEEDILTSTNLIQQRKVIEKLLESVIADPKVKLNDLLIGDKNALMVGTRILGYGKDYECVITDPDTGEKVDVVIDLTKLKHKEIDETSYDNGNLFSFELPNSKKVVEFKLLTQDDENKVSELLKDYEKLTKLTGVDKTVTTRLKYIIQSIDGDTNQKTIDDFVVNDPQALLVVEFAENNWNENLKKVKDLEALIGDTSGSSNHSIVLIEDQKSQNRISEMRKSGLNIMMSMKSEAKPVSFVEDCAVPLHNLAEYTQGLTDIFDKYQTSGTWYAHASVGCLHVRPVLNMKDNKEKRIIT